VRFLEIGVSKGGSLDMWRSYFGPEAVIYGIDIDEACAQFDGRSAQVRIGSQDDPAFLASVVAEMGGVDVVLDDGSHDSRHIRASLDVLFPLLSEGGVYMMEDLHAAYWVSHSGGYRRPSSIMETVKTDDRRPASLVSRARPVGGGDDGQSRRDPRARLDHRSRKGRGRFGPRTRCAVTAECVAGRICAEVGFAASFELCRRKCASIL
jgi:hypothetical protein